MGYTQDHPVQKAKNVIHKFQSLKANIEHGFPHKKLKILGVTGTDGKTTVSSMLYHILQNAGFKTAYVSTIKAKIGDKDLDTGLHVTTPDPWDVPKYMKMMVNEGIEYAVLESTSSGLEQNRLHGIKFEGSIITNIKSDHLDYHKTWENYAKAKFRIVEMTKSEGIVVFNKDDEKSAKWLQERIEQKKLKTKVEWASYSELENPKHSIEGISFSYKGAEFSVPIIGKHNFINSLQIIKLCENFIELEKIREALSTFKTPEGRMEIIQQQPFSAIVDFAHTPIALESALNSVNDIKVDGARIITIFGCAGKRDKGRRLMGEVSSRLSDITILTAEDPRDEKLKDINSEIYEHSKKNGGVLVSRFKDHAEYEASNLENLRVEMEKVLSQNLKPVFAFDEDSTKSREDALEFALKIAKPNDIVFSTGKGHEKSLAFGPQETEYPWSDQETIREILKSKNQSSK